MQTVISADIGTTAAKVSLVERTGVIISTYSSTYPLENKGKKVEQNTYYWWDAFRKGLKNIYSHHNTAAPEAIVLSGQMQDLICVNNGKVQDKAILYSDTRARDEWLQLNRELGEASFTASTMNLSDPASLPAKILWLKNNEPGRLSNETKILLGAHDFICWKLTNRFTTDYTNGSSTGLMNFKLNQWDTNILNFLKIREETLPELVKAGEISGFVTAEAARETGLPEGLPVIHGAGDAGASTIGAGAGVDGVISCYLGTSGWIAATGDGAVDPNSGIFNLRHPDPNKVINIGPMLMTGGNVEWILNTFLKNRNGILPDNAFELFTQIAERASPGSGGVFYLPYLLGERSPFHDPDARGSFIGLKRDTGQAEMFRAVLEGISYSLNSILKIMTPANQSGRQIYLSGGGTENPLWVKILASITQCNVLIASNARESGVLGNVIIAGMAMRWFDSYKLPPGFLKIEKEYLPDKKLCSFYASGMEIFSEIYPALKKTFKKIPALLNY